VRTLAVVPARGGSKGLPGKNARLFHGESLLGRAIRIGQETCDDVVFTTDSYDLAVLASAYGVTVRMRPAELATDEAPMLPVVQDAIRDREGDLIVLLQPTQPLRTAEHVRRAIAMLQETDSSAIVSVRRVPERYLPDRALHLFNDEFLSPATRHGQWDRALRQEARPAFIRCGTVYATRRGVVEEGSLHGPYCRPLILEGDALSIDTMEDFERLEAMAR
jgi:CMP-N,N'-diacetyllegionaminic acid synthase